MQCGSSIARLNPVPYILRLYRDSNVSTCYMAYPSGGYRSYSIHIHIRCKSTKGNCNEQPTNSSSARPNVRHNYMLIVKERCRTTFNPDSFSERSTVGEAIKQQEASECPSLFEKETLLEDISPQLCHFCQPETSQSST